MQNLLEEYKKTEFNYNNFVEPTEKIAISFRRSPKVEITGRGGDDKYNISFTNRKTGKVLCSNVISKKITKWVIFIDLAFFQIIIP